MREVLERVADKLGNTPTICRKCYVHPEVIAAYEAGELKLGRVEGDDGIVQTELDAAERAVLRFLKTRGR